MRFLDWFLGKKNNDEIAIEQDPLEEVLGKPITELNDYLRNHPGEQIMFHCGYNGSEKEIMGVPRVISKSSILVDTGEGSPVERYKSLDWTLKSDSPAFYRIISIMAGGKTIYRAPPV